MMGESGYMSYWLTTVVTFELITDNERGGVVEWEGRVVEWEGRLVEWEGKGGRMGREGW